MAYGVESEGKTMSGPRDWAYPKKRSRESRMPNTRSSGSGSTDGRGGTPFSSGRSGEGSSNNSKMLRGGRDSMSSGDMADELPLKITRIKSKKASVDKKQASVPAGAQGGALGNASLRQVTTGLRNIFRTRGGSPSGNPTGEINLRA